MTVVVIRRTKPRQPPVPALIKDHGLDARWRRGDVVVEQGPDPDPDPDPGQGQGQPAAGGDRPDRTVTRGRAVCAYDRLHARGGITDAQREAADRYGVLREAELGARADRGPKLVRSPNPWQKGHPIQSQIQAAAALRRLHELLGVQARVVVILLVVENMPVKAIAARLGLSPDIAMGVVLAALTRLAEHWGMTRE